MEYKDNPELNPEIIAAFRKGDQDAFATFFHYHYRSLCFFAGQLIRDTPEAEDIVKDAYIKLWNRHEDFESAQNIKAFLFITTRNACLNFLRHAQVKEAFSKEFAYLDEQQGPEMVLNQLIRTEMVHHIYKKIEELPGKRKEVFKLAYIDGLKNDEIAEILKISTHTVKEHKCKALQLLRQHFSDNQMILFLTFCTQALAILHRHG